MHDHNLDDLIIDEEIVKQTDKTKGILTIVALVIVLLIIAIVLTKIILKEPKVDTIVKEQNTQLIDPELTLKKKTHNVKKEDTYTIEDNNVDIEDNIDNDILDDIEDDTVKKDNKDIVELDKPHIKQKIDKPIVSKDSEVSKLTTTNNHSKVDKVIIDNKFEQIKSKSQVKSIDHKSITKKVVSEKYYIQVGSFTKEPSKKFLSIIKRSGFKYNILSTSKGIKKLLIGPYLSRQAVDKALPKVRDRINKNAFVYKVK